MTGGWITQADRSRWQQRAAAELAAILAAHPGIPVIAWTVTASGGALSGQVLAPAAGRRGLFGQWRQALGLDEVTETPSAGGTACLPARPRCPRRRRGQRHRDRLRRRGGRAGEPPRHPDAADGRAGPGSRRPAGKADGRGAPGVPGRGPGLRPAGPGLRRAAVRGDRLRRPAPRQGLCRRTGSGGGATGKPDLAEFTATAEPGWHGHLPLAPAPSPAATTARGPRAVPAAPNSHGSGPGGPASAAGAGSHASPAPRRAAGRACRIGYCALWATRTSLFCYGHAPAGRATAARTPRSSPPPARTRARARSTSTCAPARPAAAGDAVRPAVPRRRARTPSCRPGHGSAVVRGPGRQRRILPAGPARAGMARTSGPRRRSGRGWRPFVLDARRRRSRQLADGTGWDTEYPRDTWRLRNLGIEPGRTRHHQLPPDPPALAEGPGQAWTRWRLSTGLAPARPGTGAPGLTRLRRLPRRPRRRHQRPGRHRPRRCWNATWPTCTAMGGQAASTPQPRRALSGVPARQSAGTAGTTAPARQPR